MKPQPGSRYNKDDNVFHPVLRIPLGLGEYKVMLAASFKTRREAAARAAEVIADKDRMAKIMARINA